MTSSLEVNAHRVAILISFIFLLMPTFLVQAQTDVTTLKVEGITLFSEMGTKLVSESPSSTTLLPEMGTKLVTESPSSPTLLPEMGTKLVSESPSSTTLLPEMGTKLVTESPSSPTLLPELGTTLVTETPSTPTPVYCDPIVVTDCPEDIHKLVPENREDFTSPRDTSSYFRGGSSNGGSTSTSSTINWDPPTTPDIPEPCQVDITNPYLNPGDVFSVGLTTVIYTFGDVTGNEAICSFTVNITEVYCDDNEYQCQSSGRCIDEGLVCDSFPDCPDHSDENEPQCSEIKEQCYAVRTSFCRGFDKFLPQVEVDVPRKRRADIELERRLWKFATSEFDENLKVFLWRIQVAVGALDKVGFQTNRQRPAEFRITIRTSKSKHEVTISQPNYNPKSSFDLGNLRSPLELLPNEEVDIVLEYTADPLNEVPIPVILRRSLPCTDCVYVRTRAFPLSSCDDVELLGCINSFYSGIEVNDPQCIREELTNVYETVYGKLCHKSPAIIYITSDQEEARGFPVELTCATTGIPPPMVSWVNADSEPVLFVDPDNRFRPTDNLIQSASGTVIVGDTESRYYCKYASQLGSGISEAVGVKPLSATCIESSQDQNVLQNNNEQCTTVTGVLSSYQYIGFDREDDGIYTPSLGISFDELAGYEGTSLIYAVTVPGDIFRQMRPQSSSPVTSIVLTIFKYTVVPSRKRSVDASAVYRRRYDNVFVLDPLVVFEIDHPVRIIDISASIRLISVELHFPEWQLSFEYQPEGSFVNRKSIFFNMTQCADFAAEELETDCSAFYQGWTDLIEESIQYGCDSKSYSLYQTCIGEAIAAPVIRIEPRSLVADLSTYSQVAHLIIYGQVALHCSIDHAARLEWLKLDKDSEQIVEMVTGNVLRFDRFEPTDQGSYVCVGYGGGIYDDIEVRTSPAVVVGQGGSTFVASLHFLQFGYSDDFGRGIDQHSSGVYELPLGVYELQKWFSDVLSDERPIRTPRQAFGGEESTSYDPFSGDSSSSSGYDPFDYKSPTVDESTPVFESMPPLFSADVRGAFPVSTENGTYTGLETILYYVTRETMVSDSDLIELIKIALMDNLEGADITSLGQPDPFSLKVINIAPVIRIEPRSLVADLSTYSQVAHLIIYGQVALHCSIDHAARLEWLKLDKDSEQIVEMVTGNVLRFDRFEPTDQGSYVCVGYGGGIYDDIEVRTSPAVVVGQGGSTFVASLHFLQFGYSDDFGRGIDQHSSGVYELPLGVYELQKWFSDVLSDERPIRTPRQAFGGEESTSYDPFSGDSSSSSGYDPFDYKSPTVDESTPVFESMPPLFSADVRGAFPVSTENGTYTGLETILYYVTRETMVSDSDLIELIKIALMDNLEGADITSLGQPDPFSLKVINIGSCPEEQTTLPYVLNWPETQVGQVAESVEECPGYSGQVGPRATRQCVGDFVSAPEWKDIVVNDCFDDEIMEVNDVIILLSQNTVTNDNVTEVASDLADITNDTTNVDATGLEAVAKALESIVSVKSPSLAEVTSSVVDIIDNILNIDDDVFREAVDRNAPTRILRSLEEQLTALQKQGVNFTQSGNNIDIKAVQVSQANVVNGIGFASIVQNMMSVGNTEIFNNPENIPINEADTSIALPPEVITRFRNKVNDTAMVPATFILYQNSKLFQSNRLVTESTSERKRVVGTRVISATIEGIEIYNLPQEQPVVSTYLNTEEGNENNTLENFQCVFWDFDLEKGRGDWSNKGCMLKETTESDRTVCHCDHLTSFAVLIDVHGQKYSLLALDVLSIIGCFISITALIIMLVTYLATKSLRSKTPKKILICLSFTLLCLYVVFVAGVDRTNTSTGCAFVAALLHYLTLSSVCWMGVEAVNLYLLIVKVFNADVSHFMLKAAIAAWGGPLIPVLIVLAADYTQYVNQHHCFMKPSYGFYFADLLLIFIILAFNIVVFILILHKLTCGRNKNLGRSSDRDKKQSITRALNAIAICAILGLTWVFGFLTIVENRASSLAFQVLFCLFNSLQGLFIFVLFCVRPEEVRNVWKRWFGCSGKGKYGGFLSSSHDGRSHGTDIANTRSTGTTNFEAINPPPENVQLISISQDQASNGQKTPQQPESVEPLSKSEDKVLNEQKTPQEPDSVEPLSKSEDKVSNGQNTPQQPDNVEPLSKSEDKASNGQNTPQQPDNVEPLSKSEDQTANAEKTVGSLEPLSDRPSDEQDTHKQDA